MTRINFTHLAIHLLEAGVSADECRRGYLAAGGTVSVDDDGIIWMDSDIVGAMLGHCTQTPALDAAKEKGWDDCKQIASQEARDFAEHVVCPCPSSPKTLAELLSKNSAGKRPPMEMPPCDPAVEVARLRDIEESLEIAANKRVLPRINFTHKANHLIDASISADECRRGFLKYVADHPDLEVATVNGRGDYMMLHDAYYAMLAGCSPSVGLSVVTSGVYSDANGNVTFTCDCLPTPEAHDFARFVVKGERPQLADQTASVLHSSPERYVNFTHEATHLADANVSAEELRRGYLKFITEHPGLEVVTVNGRGDRMMLHDVYRELLAVYVDSHKQAAAFPGGTYMDENGFLSHTCNCPPSRAGRDFANYVITGAPKPVRMPADPAATKKTVRIPAAGFLRQPEVDQYENILFKALRGQDIPHRKMHAPAVELTEDDIIAPGIITFAPEVCALVDDTPPLEPQAGNATDQRFSYEWRADPAVDDVPKERKQEMPTRQYGARLNFTNIAAQLVRIPAARSDDCRRGFVAFTELYGDARMLEEIKQAYRPGQPLVVTNDSGDYLLWTDTILFVIDHCKPSLELIGLKKAIARGEVISPPGDDTATIVARGFANYVVTGVSLVDKPPRDTFDRALDNTMDLARTIISGALRGRLKDARAAFVGQAMEIIGHRMTA